MGRVHGGKLDLRVCCLGASARLLELATSLLCGPISCRPPESGRPAMPRYRTPFPSLRSGVVGCPTVQRAPASARVCDLPHVGKCSQPLFVVARQCSDVSLRIKKTTLYSGSFGSGVD